MSTSMSLESHDRWAGVRDYWVDAIRAGFDGTRSDLPKTAILSIGYRPDSGESIYEEDATLS